MNLAESNIISGIISEHRFLHTILSATLKKYPRVLFQMVL